MQSVVVLLVWLLVTASAHNSCSLLDCARGNCYFQGCTKPVHCSGGACYFSQCKHPTCTGGSCVFDNSKFPSCGGGGCDFNNNVTPLRSGFCLGGGCSVDGIRFKKSSILSHHLTF